MKNEVNRFFDLAENLINLVESLETKNNSKKASYEENTYIISYSISEYGYIRTDFTVIIAPTLKEAEDYFLDDMKLFMTFNNLKIISIENISRTI